MDNGKQQALLLAQLNKKRELKQKYLYQTENTAQQKKTDTFQRTAFGELVMANIMLMAIKGRKDIFGVIARFRSEVRSASFGGTLFDNMLAWCEELSETLDCGAYEFFIDDRLKRQKIVHGLLEDLKREACDGWEDISMEDNGNVSFVLPHFDYYYRMTDQPKAEVSLVFRKETEPDGGSHYWLMIGDISRKKPDDLFPDHAILWDERSGFLKEFMDAAITDLKGGWVLFKESFARRGELLRSESVKLEDLCAVLEERPEGLNFKAVLQTEKKRLEAIRAEARAEYERMPAALKDGPRGENAKHCLLLLGGAAKSLERAILSWDEPEQAPPADILSEAAYLLESAGNAVFQGV